MSAVSGDSGRVNHVSGIDSTAHQPEVIAEPKGRLVLSCFGATPAWSGAIALDGTMVLGRAPSCGLVLPDAAASRQHVELRPNGDGAELIDLESRNGTFVNGRRTARSLLSVGDIVRVGNSILRLSREEEDWQPATIKGPLIGGATLAPVRRLIKLVGPTELSVLILGETGTGKEVVARLLHEASGRTGPFVAVNCAALPDALVESELLGHVRGAFTGATQARRGLIAAAEGGTLFLDEIGELPPAAQAKLLRVLEDRVIRPVGSEQERQVDVRVLSATNRDLTATFRPDLHARISVVEIRLPPLRSRPEDLPALVTYLATRRGLAPLALHPDALEALALYDWPQNVRELEQVVRNAALDGADLVQVVALPDRIRANLVRARQETPPSHAAPGSAVEPRARLVEALRKYQGNVRKASESLGMGRGHVYRLLKRWGVDPAQFRGTDGP